MKKVRLAFVYIYIHNGLMKKDKEFIPPTYYI